MTNGQVEFKPFERYPVNALDHYKQQMLHSAFCLGDAVVMASEGMTGLEIVFGNGNYISIAAENHQLAENYYQKGSTGGHILMPFEKHSGEAYLGCSLINTERTEWLILKNNHKKSRQKPAF